MNAVLHDITDHNQSNVVSFDDRRELDGIKGELTAMCRTLRVTPATLLLAAQIVQNALHAGANDADAYLAGVRYAKRHQEPAPGLEAAYRDYELARQAKRIADARRPLSVEGELAAVDAAFGGDAA